MSEKTAHKKIPWVKICLIVMLVACGFLFVRLLLNLFDREPPKEYFRSSSTLINTEEIASLSVSEFIYNGIAQFEKSNGDIDCNILYNSTVKVSVDVENIRFDVDDKDKIVTFTFSEFTYRDPVIDPDSFRFIPSDKIVEIKDAIALCRKDALAEAKKSDKLLSLAEDNLKSIVEAWYSPIFDGYTFEFVFETVEGGEAE